MAININAKTSGVGGLETSADNSGNINIQSGGSTVMSVTSSGVAVTGSFSQNGAVYSTQPSFRNLIINGDMRIDQRNAGASVSTQNAYTVDRWQALASVASKYTTQQNAGSVTPPDDFTNYLGATSTSAYSVSSGDYFYLLHKVEGLNASHLKWGTANAKTVTLSFKVRSSLTGTFVVAIRSGADDAAYPATYTINSANTWETKSITIAGPTSGTFATTNATCFTTWFSLGAGSGFDATANVWGAGGALSVSGSQSVVGTSGATFYITGVQLEVGSTATDFENLPYDVELQRCMRYYEKSYNYADVAGTDTQNGRMNFGGNNAGLTTSWLGGGVFRFNIIKRTAPTLVVYDASGNEGKCTRFYLGGPDTDNSAVFTADSSETGFVIYSSGTSNGSGIGFHFTASAEL
jgi:hypothetical protein